MTNNPTPSKPNPMNITLTRKYKEIQDGKKTIDTVTLKASSNDSSLLDNIKLQKMLDKK
ncbi:14751_t:CDS:2 [Cetraspora pellucida]|uniref:14751_t:CDS:1 n=1 Tax=Cetraspora pellucida TaxID=1433469 RepID=A0A9N8YSG2_9GLOM|nr:14751_t:CDS:2 [Cetraspora pellucida]